jgi:histidine decarboxylase
MAYKFHRADRSAAGLVLPADRPVIAAELAAFEAHLEAAWHTHIGYPGTADIQHSLLGGLLTKFALNNIGDPWDDEGAVPNHTKPFERKVLDLLAELFRAPAGAWWGAVTSGSTEGTLEALRIAHRRYPEGIVVHSAASHISVNKVADVLSLDTAVIAADDRGEIDYTDLRATLAQHRHRRPIIVANIGTTFTEAVDDIRKIAAVCRRLGITDRFIHADAALSGIPLALLNPSQRPGFDLADGADSIVTSGHKFLSTMMPCAVLIVANRDATAGVGVTIDYTGCHDTTIATSRNGHTPLLLWEVLRRHGIEGLRRRAERARHLAAYAQQRLTDAGWTAWRHPHAFTVMLREPPSEIAARWALPPTKDWTRLICVPGITRYHVDRLVEDLESTLDSGERAAAPATVAGV